MRFTIIESAGAASHRTVAGAASLEDACAVVWALAARRSHGPGLLMVFTKVKGRLFAVGTLLFGDPRSLISCGTQEQWLAQARSLLAAERRKAAALGGAA